MVTSEIFKVSAQLMVQNVGVIYFAVIFAANVATTVVFLVGSLYYMCKASIINILRLLPYVPHIYPWCKGIKILIIH